MTHSENGGCCCGSDTKEKKEGCCSSEGKGSCCSSRTGSNLVTILAVVVAIGAVAYASTKDAGTPAMPAKVKAEAAKLIKGEDTVVAKMNGKDIRKSDVAMAIKELGARSYPMSAVSAFVDDEAFIVGQFVTLRHLNFGHAVNNDVFGPAFLMPPASADHVVCVRRLVPPSPFHSRRRRAAGEFVSERLSNADCQIVRDRRSVDLAEPARVVRLGFPCFESALRNGDPIQILNHLHSLRAR